MIDKIRNKKIIPFLLIAFVLIALLVLFLPLENIARILLLTTLTIFVVSFFDYKIGLFLFLFTRPIIDFSAEYTLFSLDKLDISLPTAFGGAMLLFALVVIGSHFKKIKDKRLIYVWAIFILWACVSLSYSFAVAETIKELARYSSIFFSFLLGALLIRNNNDLTKLAKVLIFSALIPSFVALYQFFNHSGLIEEGVNRLLGTMTHPNMLAFYLILPITLSIFVFLNIKRSRVEFYLYLILSLFYTFILFLTYTRGAYLALAIIFLIVGSLKFKKFLLGSILVLFVFYLIAAPFQARVNSIFVNNPYGSINWRIELWEDGYDMFRQQPILGHGAGLAEEVISQNRHYSLGAIEPHNDYLRLALEGGIVSVIIYLTLILVLLLSLLKNYKQQKKPRIKMINLFILALAVSLTIMSFGDNVLDDTSLQWHFWALIGGLLSVQSKK